MASISPPSISNLKKSILKPSPSPSPCPTPPVSLSAPTSSHRHAHFPPPGEEPTARFSGVDYDRSPIVVLPNVCALPARGCPGKTYVIEEPTRSLPGIRGASVIASATGNVHSHPHHHQQQQQQPAQPTPIHHDMAKHLHPSKLRKVSQQPPMAGASLSHFESSSASESEDYDSFFHSSSYTGGRQPVASIQVSFPGNGSPTAGTFAAERDRKTSTSSTATVTPTPTVAQHKGKLKKKRDSIGNNRIFSTTSESESDACLEGF